jgi:hypothetical protein
LHSSDWGIDVALNKQTAENQRFLPHYPVDEATGLNKTSALIIDNWDGEASLR